MSHLSPEGRTLFERARRDLAPRGEDRRRVGQAIAAELGAAASVASVATRATIASTRVAKTAATGLGKGSAATSPTIVATVKWIGAAALAGGVGLAGASIHHTARASHAALTPTEVSSPAAVDADPRSPAPPLEVPVTSAAPAPKPPDRANLEHALAPGPSSRASPSVARGSVAEEARLLRDANVALQGGDAAGALALLDEHRRAYPKGTLSEESMAERVFALCRMGRAADARQEGHRFLQSYPKSPLAEGVRESCALSPRKGEAFP